MAAVNLNTLSPDQLRKLFASLDNILFDNDGVLSAVGDVLPGACECVAQFKASGKNVKIITNNAGMGSKRISAMLHNKGLECPAEDIITPTRVMVKYLQDINFKGLIWLIGMEGMEEELKQGGFTMAESEKHDHITVQESKKYFLNTNKDIRAIVIDFSMNETMGNFIKAITYLKDDPEILMLYGATDTRIPYAPGRHVAGPAYYQKCVVDATHRKPLIFGKPSENCGKFLIETLGCDPARTLFVGDSLDMDIGFANKLDFKTLLVLSGIAKLEDVNNCNDRLKPDYYVNNIAELNCLLNRNQN